MKKLNPRLTHVELTVQMFKAIYHQACQARKSLNKEFSIHGKKQNIRVTFHGESNKTFGDLVFIDPADSLVSHHPTPNTPVDDFMRFFDKSRHWKRDDKRRFYDLLDMLHVLNAMGYKIQAADDGYYTVNIYGQVSDDPCMGRFELTFYLDSDTRSRHWFASMLAQVGDYVTPDLSMIRNYHNLCVAFTQLDNENSGFVEQVDAEGLAESMHELVDTTQPSKTSPVVTTKEEVGLRGTFGGTMVISEDTQFAAPRPESLAKADAPYEGRNESPGE